MSLIEDQQNVRYSDKRRAYAGKKSIARYLYIKDEGIGMIFYVFRGT